MSVGAVAVVAQQASSIDDITLRFSYYAPENTPEGAVLFNFTAKYSDNHHDVVVTASSSYFTVERVNGFNGLWNVRLNTSLDREVITRFEVDRRQIGIRYFSFVETENKGGIFRRLKMIRKMSKV